MLVFDASTLSDTELCVDERGVSIDGIALQGGRGWIRRLAPEGWREEYRRATHDDVVRGAWMQALTSVLSLAGVLWLTDLSVFFAAEDKLAQYATARQLGFAVPPTALVSRRKLLPRALGNELVLKPHGLGQFREDDGKWHVVYATAMKRDDPRLDQLGSAPFLCQRRLVAAAHLRVVTVGKRSWCCELSAGKAPLDWRDSEETHSSFNRVARPSVEHDAVRLAQVLGVGYSSQDWIVDRDGRTHFIDLNPAGQWLFLPVAEDVTEAIVDELVG
jgi:hypothetical protein